MSFHGKSIEGGFRQPVFDAQATFRAVMEALARPGTIQKSLAAARPPAPLTPEAGAVALTLCDHDTPIWLDPPLQAEEAVRAWLAFHTGAPIVTNPSDAHFAFVSYPATLISLDNFAQGTQDYPDRSATLVLQVETLANGPAIALEGPGIRTTARLAPSPMPRHFAEQWVQNRARFPRGIDLVLVAREGVAALPRTTRITAEE
ncbi:alpha-D-ribose 1-methylphosphonate 5-triphosphate synthase subunit PhnH [Mesorhizobium sp. J18]|uniref:phosphonate C-P lyase system protein PhnH n=1 Tax=Mesorhizobium sp. J18 TaxID=935263 RepID=UPI00119A9A55|nr:phosphonate C-P lyase system protein PhnH [Mesorhizobium sp. J18]TWG91290.1 alpha-D-ribose 1-methylphosphonate 5-triphosphate synthase subunit PhnH [Mesorhizobium sp. J18]